MHARHPLARGSFRERRLQGLAVLRRLLAVSALLACDNGQANLAAFDGALLQAGSEPSLDAADWAATWRVLPMPSAGSGPSLARTPRGWLALSGRGGIGRLVSTPTENYLYRSEDGTHWQRLPLLMNQQDLELRGLAYGLGQYVLVGQRQSVHQVVFTSMDGKHWNELALDNTYVNMIWDLVFSGERFFALTNGNAVWAYDGARWSRSALRGTVQAERVTFGHDQYLLVGNGPPHLSRDGLAWRPAPLDCALAGACYPVPNGTVMSAYLSGAVFAAGYYYVDRLRSANGWRWEEQGEAYPAAYLSGRIVGHWGADAFTFAAWPPGGMATPIATLRLEEQLPEGVTAAEARRWDGSRRPQEQSIEDFPGDLPLPDQLDYSWRDGLDCNQARCVAVGANLYLVP